MENGISMDDLLNEASGGAPSNINNNEGDSDPENNPTPEAGSEGNPEPADDNKDNNPQPESKTEPKKDDKPKSNPMKEVRDKYNQAESARKKMESTMDRFYNGDYKFNPRDFRTDDGKIDYDKLVEAMDEADNVERAKTNNITPEIQKELDRIEKEKVEMRKQQLQVAMDRELASMQIEMGLKKADVNQFFADALQQKRNPYQWLAQGGNIQDLYYIIYRDKLIKAKVDQAVAEERAKWDNPNRGRTPAPNPAKPKVPASPVDANGMSLNDLLKAASGN